MRLGADKTYVQIPAFNQAGDFHGVVTADVCHKVLVGLRNVVEEGRQKIAVQTVGGANGQNGAVVRIFDGERGVPEGHPLLCDGHKLQALGGQFDGAVSLAAADQRVSELLFKGGNAMADRCLGGKQEFGGL